MTEHKEEQWESWFDSLAENDFVIIDDFLPTDLLSKIKSHFNHVDNHNGFKKAAVGSFNEQCVISEVRGDYIHWLDHNEHASISELFNQLDELKALINRYCYLSIKDFEFHFAHYPRGSYYKKHLDQFSNRSNRLISVVLYLNENWQLGDGGELKIYPIHEPIREIYPLENRLVLFKSDTLYHEVMKSNKSRKSITGWMLHKSSKIAFITE
jgi:SM-20-related protein